MIIKNKAIKVANKPHHFRVSNVTIISFHFALTKLPTIQQRKTSRKKESDCEKINGVENKLTLKDFPGGSDGKVSVYNAGDLGSIPGLGRFPGEGNDNLLGNPMDRGAWQATYNLRGHKSQT